ncbi:hypothetical protein ACSQ67_019849 [Phaseolus vulgaris]
MTTPVGSFGRGGAEEVDKTHQRVRQKECLWRNGRVKKRWREGRKRDLTRMGKDVSGRMWRGGTFIRIPKVNSVVGRYDAALNSLIDLVESYGDTLVKPIMLEAQVGSEGSRFREKVGVSKGPTRSTHAIWETR